MIDKETNDKNPRAPTEHQGSLKNLEVLVESAVHHSSVMWHP